MTYSGIRRESVCVAEEGARPSPSPTNTLETQSQNTPVKAAGGATIVPNDQNVTPANKTEAPPTLQVLMFWNSV